MGENIALQIIAADGQRTNIGVDAPIGILVMPAELIASQDQSSGT